MKTMAEMQAGVLAKARWDGGYPRAVHMGMGIVALARNAEEEAAMRRGTLRAHVFGGILGLLGALAVTAWALA